jgi:hypothetical protein
VARYDRVILRLEHKLFALKSYGYLWLLSGRLCTEVVLRMKTAFPYGATEVPDGVRMEGAPVWASDCYDHKS